MEGRGHARDLSAVVLQLQSIEGPQEVLLKVLIPGHLPFSLGDSVSRSLGATLEMA